MCNLASRGPKCDEVCARFDRRNKPKKQWWDREPGYFRREELPRLLKRRTDTQFLREHCRHSGEPGNACKGVCIGPDPLQGKRELAPIERVAQALQKAASP